jgi:hypothetical protein
MAKRKFPEVAKWRLADSSRRQEGFTISGAMLDFSG